MRTFSTAASIAAVSALLLLAGCGDSDETGSDGASHDDYVAEVDAICADTAAQIEAEGEELLAGEAAPDGRDLERIVTEITVPALRDQYGQIAELEPPAGEEDEVQAILDEAASTLDEVEKDPRSALTLVGEPSPFDELNRLQVDYGLTKCGGAEEPA